MGVISYTFEAIQCLKIFGSKFAVFDIGHECKPKPLSILDISAPLAEWALNIAFILADVNKAGMANNMLGRTDEHGVVLLLV